MRRWFRMQMRKFIKRPKDLAQAAVIRRRLAFCYLFVAWNGLGLFIYYRLRESYPMTPSEQKKPAFWYLRLIGQDQTEVITFQGLTKKSHTHFDRITDTETPSDTHILFTAYAPNEAEKTA